MSHDVLLQVLSRILGIEGKALNWFYFYLESSNFHINLSKSYSEERNLTFRVGSCVVPVLDLTYASTMSDHFTNQVFGVSTCTHASICILIFKIAVRLKLILPMLNKYIFNDLSQFKKIKTTDNETCCSKMKTAKFIIKE